MWELQLKYLLLRKIKLVADSYYVPFGEIDYVFGDIVSINGIEERIERITGVDINFFEDKYGNNLNQKQIARVYFVSIGTVTTQ